MKFEKDIMDVLIQFAHDQLASGSGALYKSRGEAVQQKVIDDIVSGKMGEYCAYMTISKYFPDVVTEPDLEIYKGRRKSFGADLSVGDIGVHVKTQSFGSIKRYGKSWLFQKSDKLVSSPSEKDIIAFVSVGEDGEAVFDFACRAVDLVSVYGTPKVPSYANTKKALYYIDIEKSNIPVYRDNQLEELFRSLFEL